MLRSFSTQKLADKEKLNTQKLDEFARLAERADRGDNQAVTEFDMLMKYPKAVEKQLTLR